MIDHITHLEVSKGNGRTYKVALADSLLLNHSVGHWTLAVARISDEDRQNINFSRPDKLNILSELQALTEQSRQECIERRW